MADRTMSVAGSFYPANEHEILAMIEHFNTILSSHPDALHRFELLKGNAIIVPHAGWIYSGFTANIAFRILKNTHPKTIVVIGPSHRVGFDGASIADIESYQTPLGSLTINRNLTKDLMQRFGLSYYPDAHHEHSTEVQMPFIKHYFPDVNVIEIVYAYSEPSQIEPIIAYCLNQGDVAVVISTDLSHYYSLEQANQIDEICLEAIRDKSTVELHQGCEACGIIGVEAMLNVAKKKGLKSTILDYRTSADASGDSARVVGYVSALFQ
ncbi:MAG: AmmeMemoRadiSam system protein B [Sulfuricurvum sp.]|uniref:AmmeMemoRadiSam system protein B n=1 Tax=Sulfuricurvum sp. TaxID=2025608 RepID=UPI002604A96B|nr:AmmeMemoRadiSam system protein B [Sulfuricurvum sp.]MDD2368926.1 AmmeMemoRadiSam system protein B [Sulfuricurvum sp.]MDD5118106.1 AmmeMemoRadiSam system protein B [Sulfuricurvum sp.]